MENSQYIKKLFIASLITTIVVILMAHDIESRVLQQNQKRSVAAHEFEECRTSAVCGWEVYNASTRAHQYYVSSSCKCKHRETCIRVEDDINVPAYVFRCREIRWRNKSSSRTTTESPIESS